VRSRQTLPGIFLLFSETWSGLRVASIAKCRIRFAISQCNIVYCVAGVLLPRGRGAAEWSVMLKFLRKCTAIPVVKYSIIAITSFLWLVGFADQLPDVEQTVKYVGISLLMLAVAAMA
jgi:hypothetical protein